MTRTCHRGTRDTAPVRSRWTNRSRARRPGAGRTRTVLTPAERRQAWCSGGSGLPAGLPLILVPSGRMASDLVGRLGFEPRTDRLKVCRYQVRVRTRTADVSWIDALCLY